MRAAHLPIQRPRQAKLLVVDGRGHIRHLPRRRIVDLFRTGDLVIANDAATLPASLSGIHEPSGQVIEVRLAGRPSLTAEGIRHPIAVAFGSGDFLMRTEDRPSPPKLAKGDALRLGPLHATVEELMGHPRLVRLAFQGSAQQIWEGLARHGRPIQYSHITTPLALWDVWTPIAGPPVAFEPPSAGFALDWNLIGLLKARRIAFATVTHAAGISSTGDPELDALLPFDEPYHIPHSTALALRVARARGARVIAIGTTVVRSLEDAVDVDGMVQSGGGIATQRIGRSSRLRVVDAILSGTHEPGTSHHELLRAFVDGETLDRIDRQLGLGEYETHEFGDSVFLERMAPHRCLGKERNDERRTIGAEFATSLSHRQIQSAAASSR
ncbi:MAG: S-adenosylmethionine:tRNA ribosyltransferase-isomerase [Acidobacteria bacterium]|nr:S-adenosylmethionine:tRNA ribosyltransferase-isomerase [Acidobacteriota bacterium]